MGLQSKIFNIQNEQEFEKITMEVYNFQAKNNPIYKEYIQHLNIPEPTCIREIPFLPISFFKTHTVISNTEKPALVFKSSGTGGQKSSHSISDLSLYLKSFNLTYDTLIGNPEDQVILALLPSYQEQGASSLVYMVDHLIKRTNHKLSGYFLSNLDDLIQAYNDAIKQGKDVVIFGVSYALLDLAELNPDLSQARVIETGGMKGRRKELTKKELHTILKKGLNTSFISSEYGMTELLSQAYSFANGLFKTGTTMRVLIREVNDPFNYIEDGKTGGINVIDLANVNSCSFIATQDLGKILPEGFELMGRFDNADIRGCNLLVH
ncbi:MAG: acyl transferase [Crocinitomicaceae bacterium]|nr:acyl transferase [Crocinitomicaceae bacterium]MDG1776643.1 acyl transferase [Crocinitomicaceae bacterium]